MLFNIGYVLSTNSLAGKKESIPNHRRLLCDCEPVTFFFLVQPRSELYGGEKIRGRVLYALSTASEKL